MYGLPVVAVLALLANRYDWMSAGPAAGHLNILNNAFGLMFASWMGLALYLCFRLMVSASFRDQVLAKITFIRERDERESQLTGKAAKTTFLMSLAILIFLLCLSCIQVSVYRVPEDKAIHGKTGMVTLGLGFNVFEDEGKKDPYLAVQRQNIFSYTGLPISSSAVILLLIVWQILSYNCSMRRLIR
ncbi:MAG: hypothetical protein LLG97_03225 [Deltaproteobacteria bacterium]|nr:hypothetical protein [Deltaproteobacteria bacterium]